MQPKFLVAYENSEKSATAYYCEHGFPWWAYDATTATKYDDADKAQMVADQLVKQRARAGRIYVEAA